MDMKSLYIDGNYVTASADIQFTTFNPANGQPIATIGQASPADLELAINAAKKGFAIWSGMTATERSRALLRAVALLRERNDELAALEVKDTA